MNILVDSNILIYAINADSPKHKKAQKFLEDNLGSLSISHQNVLETVRVLTHPKFLKPMRLKLALEATDAIAQSCQIVSPNKTTYYLTLELVGKYKLDGNRIFDAYLAATALSNEISTIATDNVEDFKKITEIAIHNPFG